MTKAIDETWLADEANPVVRLHDNEPIAEFEGQDDSGDAEENYRLDMARARLAACAPEMARMLIDVECVLMAQDGATEKWRCTQCYRATVVPHGAVPEEDSPGLFKHTDDCEWLLLMRKAGLR